MSDHSGETSESDWMPIGAHHNFGSWAVLWAKRTDDGWVFRRGVVGSAHTELGTPGGIKAESDDP